MAVSTINQHEIFSFEYTHHLLLLLLSLLETAQKELGRLSEAFCNCDTVPDIKKEKEEEKEKWGLYSGDTIFLNVKLWSVWRLSGI